jgi:bacillithiol system protein YtxJ
VPKESSINFITEAMHWISLTNEKQIDQIKEVSLQKPQLIFKHSTRCSVSSIAKSRLENCEMPEGVDFYYLDLLKFRNISDKIVDEFSVYHQSPQVLLIKDSVCIYEESHTGITMNEIIENL